MPWVKLDDAFWAKPKVVVAGNEIAGAYCRMLSYCGQQLTDGVVAEEPAKFIAKAGLTKRLISQGFVEKQGTDLIIPDYLDYNPSKEKVEATRKARAESGKRGGENSSNGSSK